MDSRQLEILTAVADLGSFSQAAKHLHTVQSNVSSHVGKLEDELGLVLIDRATMTLTYEGEKVVARARRIAAEFAAISDDLLSSGDDIHGTVRVGVIGSTGRWLVPRLLDASISKHPNLRLVMTEASSPILVSQLVANRIDLALVNLPVDDPLVRTRRLFDEDLLCIAPSGHPLAAYESTGLQVAELARHRLLLGPPGTQVRDDFEVAAEREGVTISPLAELDGMRLIALLATSGYAPALLPASAVPTILTGDYVRISVEGLPRRAAGLAVRRRGLESTPVKRFRELLLDVMRTEGANQPGVYLRLT